MEDNRKIGIALPTYNRFEMTRDLIKSLKNYDFIEEIVVVDDCSTDNTYERLLNFFKNSNEDRKIKIFRNEMNLDCYFNKHEAASKCSSEWICILDPDNKFSKNYFDAIFAIPEWISNICYNPCFLKPAFDFRKWNHLLLSKENVYNFANTSVVDTGCNAMNFFISRKEYLKVWDGSINPGTFDSLYFSYCWLKAGNFINITPNMEYEHTLHEDKSNHFSTHQHKYAGFFNDLMYKIRNINV